MGRAPQDSVSILINGTMARPRVRARGDPRKKEAVNLSDLRFENIVAQEGLGRARYDRP
jgi:hypothetical protein